MTPGRRDGECAVPIPGPWKAPLTMVWFWTKTARASNVLAYCQLNYGGVILKSGRLMEGFTGNRWFQGPSTSIMSGGQSRWVKLWVLEREMAVAVQRVMENRLGLEPSIHE